MMQIYSIDERKKHIRAVTNILHGDTPLHMHNYFELELVIHGRCKQLLNGVSYDMCPGSLYLVTPADFHKIVMNYDICKEVRVINISFDHFFSNSEIIRSLMDMPDNLFANLDGEEYDKVLGMLNLIFDALTTSDSYTQRNIKNILECLIIYLLRRVEHRKNGLDNAENIQLALRYMHMHYDNAPDAEEMAKMCGYSLGYFCRLFKKTTGKTYNDFLTSLKINNAKIMLLSTKEQISNVALLCGFASISNFNRIFRDKVGISPSEFVRKNKKR